MVIMTTLEQICRRAAAEQPIGEGGFRPTANQVFFFALVWLQKKKRLIQQNRLILADQDEAALRERARLVAEHLAEWGLTVSKLKQNDERNWDLLYIQMKKVVRYFNCSQADKDDAVQEALLKVIGLLRKMFPWAELEEAHVVDLVLKHSDSLANIYDFGSPFYFFAQRIAKNELGLKLRDKGRTTPLDDGSHTRAAPEGYLNEAAGWSEAIQALQRQLTGLLGIIEHHLTPRQRQVIAYTLGGRPQFRELLMITDLTAPADIPLKAGFMTDTEIAEVIGIKPNSVRVHRADAKKRVEKIDVDAGRLLENLMSQRSRSLYIQTD